MSLEISFAIDQIDTFFYFKSQVYTMEPTNIIIAYYNCD
jgi:hypothetical protein